MVNELKGDIIFVIKEDNKTNFVKKGNNLIYEYEILLGNSICGVLVEFNHLNGEKIIYKEDNIIPHNSFRVLKNKGMPIKGKEGEFGDLYVVYVIKNYDVKLTKAQKEIFAEVLPCKKIDNKAVDNVQVNENNFQHNFSLSGI
jgi:DnaJ-class molecular chaperone